MGAQEVQLADVLLGPNKSQTRKLNHRQVNKKSSYTDKKFGKTTSGYKKNKWLYE